MITGVIKNKIDKIWTDIWAGGLTMPFKVVEQLSYLMFIRSLDQKEIENEKMAALGFGAPNYIFPQTESGQSMRWSKFKDEDAEVIFKTLRVKVFPAIKEMKYGKVPDVDATGEVMAIPYSEADSRYDGCID